MSLIDTLKALAITVRNEKKKGSNTAVRIGDLFLAIIEFIKGLSSGYIRQEGVDTYNDTSEGKISLLNKYPVPQVGWTVLVRNDETNKGKSSLYQWNGSQWINLETIIYNDDIDDLLRIFRIISNETYILAVADNKERILFGIRHDGTSFIPKGIPSDVQRKLKDITIALEELKLLQSSMGSVLSVVTDDKCLYKFIDKKGRVLAKVSLDGTIIPTKLRLSRSNIDEIKAIISRDGLIEMLKSTFSIVSDENNIYKLRDKKGKVLARISSDGTIVPAKLQLTKQNLNEIKELIDITLNDRIETNSIVDTKGIYQFPFPERFATINLIAERLPLSKEDKIKAVFQYADSMGNRVEDSCDIKGQGNSSAGSERISVAVDFDNIKVSFGSLPLQDSFHIKSYVWDKLRGVSVWAYDYITEIRETLPFGEKYPNDYIKKHTDAYSGGKGILENELPTGANFHSLGFPVRVYLNGEFRGMYCLIYKKDRANYEHNKSNVNHIHLDGNLNEYTLFNNNVDWSAFEIRNPKGLLDINGNKYNEGAELSDTDTFSKAVKDSIVRLSTAIPAIKANLSQAKFEEYFLPNTLIDYFINSQVCYNYDGFNKNWQFLTWDAKRFGISSHDWDTLFAANFLGTMVIPDSAKTILGIRDNIPTKLLVDLYKTELDARYKQLRDLGLISVDYIMKSLEKWCKRVGFENYKEDFKLYPNTPPNRDSGLNSEYWEVINTTNDMNTYDDAKNYKVGDTVIYGFTQRYVFKCVKAHNNQKPTTIMYPSYPEELGYYESLYRIKAFLDLRIPFLDTYFNYNK